MSYGANLEKRQRFTRLARLIEQLQRLPGVGPKSAQRPALHILKRPEAEVQALAQACLRQNNRWAYVRSVFTYLLNLPESAATLTGIATSV